MVDGYNVFLITIPGLSRLSKEGRAVLLDRIKRISHGCYSISEDQVFIKVEDTVGAKVIYSLIAYTDYDQIPLIVMKIDDTVNEGIYGVSHTDLWRSFFKFNPVK